MRAYQCDLCMNLYPMKKPKEVHEFNITQRKESSVNQIIDTRLDICPDCYERLIDFMDNRKPTREPEETVEEVKGGLL